MIITEEKQNRKKEKKANKNQENTLSAQALAEQQAKKEAERLENIRITVYLPRHIGGSLQQNVIVTVHTSYQATSEFRGI